MIARTIEHVCGAIDNAPEHNEPFAHLRLDGVFPAEVYSRMLELMPARQDYRSMSGRAKKAQTAEVRTKLDLFPEWVRNLPAVKRDVWNEVGQALCSTQVRHAFMRRLAPGLEKRFGEGYESVDTYPVPVLTRDVPGYKIKIHPDTRWKAMTVQFYLPRDRSIEHVGTIFHSRNADGTYQVRAKMPFAPNSGYAFAVGDDTYHSVDVVGPEVQTRDSILLTYFADTRLIEKAQNRWKRAGNLVLAQVRRVISPPQAPSA
jgi:hypothetical protein